MELRTYYFEGTFAILSVWSLVQLKFGQIYSS